jgi:hypothetical protein
MWFLSADLFVSPASLFMAKAIANSVKLQSGRGVDIAMNAQPAT